LARPPDEPRPTKTCGIVSKAISSKIEENGKGNETPEENSMGAKSEALAKRFEVKVQEAMATLEKLSDADWKKATEVEKWPVGVTAHHFAGVPEQISKMVEAFVAGQSLPKDLFSGS
jgi:hypothetical protein